nr:uncharacterized protein LOC109175033 [Ipomoea batatas]
MGCKRNAKIRKLGAVVDVPSSPEPDVDDGQQGTPLRPIFCLKRREQLREFDNKEECFILDFDPFDSSRPVSENLDPEIAVVAEKGNVACRDFPHARYVCVEFPFGTTPHEKCCKLCYCYVCDVAAPCKLWTGGHCHAVNSEGWKHQRREMRKQANIQR